MLHLQPSGNCRERQKQRNALSKQVSVDFLLTAQKAREDKRVRKGSRVIPWLCVGAKPMRRVSGQGIVTILRAAT